MARVDPGVVWITLEEARRAWGYKSKRGFTHSRRIMKVRMRKSGGVWLANVEDLCRWFGQPKRNIEIERGCSE